MNTVMRSMSWYRPGSVRLDTRRLNKVNTSLLPSEKDRRRKIRRTRKRKKCRVRQHKRDSRSSNITEYFPNNGSCTVLDKPTVTKYDVSSNTLPASQRTSPMYVLCGFFKQ